jgi:hypothetical protein
VAEAPLLAVANYGALGTYSPETVGVEPEQIRYEVANCQIAVSETKFYPMWGYAPVEALPLDIVASADPTPVDDSEGNPSIQWVVTIKGRGETIVLYGKPDLTIWAKVGPRGNVEYVSHLDRSDPDVTVDDRGPLGLFVFLRGPLAPYGW